MEEITGMIQCLLNQATLLDALSSNGKMQVNYPRVQQMLSQFDSSKAPLMLQLNLLSPFDLGFSLPS
ncbi:hypothetical protein SLE2022_226750 [Rubroshorea leprosula]